MDLDEFEDDLRGLAGLSPRKETVPGEGAETAEKPQTASGAGQLQVSRLYTTVRTARLHMLASMSLRDGASRPMRSIGQLEPEDDARASRAVTSYRYEEKVNLTCTFSFEDLNCVSCLKAHKIMFRTGTRIRPEDMGPLLFILSDQHFPACLPPMVKGECVKILRIEDGGLEQLVTKLLKVVKGHVMPAGSVVQICSLSHLKAVGLEAYCGDMVKAIDLLWQKYRGGISTIHGFPLINCDLNDGTLLNSVVNAQKWYVSVLPKRARYIHNTANMVYGPLLKGAADETDDEGDRRRLPRGLLPSAGGSIFSTCSMGSTAKLVRRTEMATETAVVTAMLEEFNRTFSMGLARDIQFGRGLESKPNHREDEKEDFIVMVIGASHADRVCSYLEKEGLTVINLAKPGWKVNEDSVEEVRKLIEFELARSPSTAAVLFFGMDNCTYFGSTQIGSRQPAIRDSAGKHHLEGRLVMATRDDIKELARGMMPLMKQVNELQKVVVTPLPRYLWSKCCADPRHVANMGGDSYKSRMMDNLMDYRRWTREFFHKQKVCGLRVVVPSDLINLGKEGSDQTVELDLWSDDSVHLSNKGYEKLGKALAVIIRGQQSIPGSAPRAARRHAADSESLDRIVGGRVSKRWLTGE